MLNFKVVSFLACLVAMAAANPDGIPGGVQQLSGNELREAENVLQNSLTKLAAGDGPYYTITKVDWATHQIVSGSLYKYQVDLKDRQNHIKKCNVSIWSQPWLPNGVEVTFDCAGESQVVKRHNA